MNWELIWVDILRPSIGPVVGLILAVSLGGVMVRWVMTTAFKEIFNYNNLPDKTRDDWIKYTTINDSAGRMLGRLETILYFVAIWQDLGIIIAGWLAFKIGSKWQVWQHIIQVPKNKLKFFSNDEDYFHARHIWGSKLLASFLVGTLANLVVALFGIGIASVISKLLMLPPKVLLP